MDNGQKQIRYSKKQMGFRHWSDLPVDVLNLIIGRLPMIIDQIHFQVVCKNWHFAELHYERDLPWLLGYDCCPDFSNGGVIAKMISCHIPFPNQKFLIRNIEMEQKEFLGAGVCASKYGWLMLQQSQKSYLFSLFSREAIKLPDMEINFNRATISSNPKSADCICFTIQSSKSSDKIRISTCSPGDLEWCTITVGGFKKAVEDVVYINGKFYCVFSGGVLGAFYISSGDWSVLTDMQPINGIQFWSRLQLVDSNGELLLVCPSQNIHVFRFSWSEMVWKEIHKLGNQVLFLGCTSFAVAAVGKASALAERIYYHGDGWCSWYYCLRRKSKHTCSDFYPWVVRDAQERIWIEPPSL